MAEHDAAAAAVLANTNAEMMAKLDSLMQNMSASVDVKIQHLSDTMRRRCILTTRRLSSAMPKFGFGELYNKMKTNDGRNVWLMRIRITSNAIETLRSDFNKKER